MTQQLPAGWYPDPNGPGQRYFDGTTWTDATAPSNTRGRKAAVLIGIAALSVIGLLMSMQSASLLTGTGQIWMGVGLTAAGVAAAFFLQEDRQIRIFAVIALVLALFSAGYMEKQIADKRNEISHMFSP